MLRKLAHVSLAVFLVLAFAAMASAAPDVASTSKKGSLLVFPKVVLTSTVETYIFIGNDNTKGTYVKCYWMDGNQNIEDFEFQITANQPIVFTTRNNTYGPAFADDSAGALTCWAETLNSTEEYLRFAKFDHLYGYAMIKSANDAVFYNATAFAVTAADVSGYCNDTSCSLPLTGSGAIDSCPKYLITNFVTQDTNGLILPADTRADLALWPCRQDLRQDRKPTCTKAKFDVWNGAEVKFTGAYACFKCFFEQYLEQVGLDGVAGYSNNGSKNSIFGRGPGFGYDKFMGDRLRTETARLRVQGIASTICNGTDAGTTGVTNARTKGCYWTDPADNTTKLVNSEATTLLGVMMYSTPGAAFAPVAGYTLFGAGYDLVNPGFIKYDNAGSIMAPGK